MSEPAFLSVTTGASREINPKEITPEQIAKTIADVTAAFENRKGESIAGSGGLELIKTHAPHRFFAIHVKRQHELSFSHVRSSILAELSLSPDTKIVQVIGDSGRFSPQGTEQGRLFLEKQLR